VLSLLRQLEGFRTPTLQAMKALCQQLDHKFLCPSLSPHHEVQRLLLLLLRERMLLSFTAQCFPWLTG
jgi:hypothetical protein